MSEQKCTKCGTTKPLGDFVRDSSKRTGYGPKCKACHRSHEHNVKRGVEQRRAPESLHERFWRQVNKGDGCWLWTGARRVYGSIRVGVRQEFAHRVSWAMRNGAVPAGLFVLHRCDNPPCVNPDHLFLGTIADNNRDRHNKGRDATGDRNGSRKYPERLVRGPRNPAHVRRGDNAPRKKLTDADIAKMRSLRASGRTIVSLAREFGISETYTGTLVRGRRR